MLADFCQLYNAGLEQRIAAYRRGRISVSYKMQADELKGVRCAAPELARWSFSVQQQVLRRLDKTYKAFFARGKGFPRFRARARYHAADFRVGDGLTLRKSGKLGFVGVSGEVKVRWHRQLPSAPKSAILTRQADKWYIVFHVEVAPVERAGPDSVGVDFGLSNLIALSNRETVERPRWVTRAERELRRRQRQLARCKRSSKTRSKRKAALAKFQGRVAAKRRDHLHKVARNLVTRFGRIGIEDLNIKGLAGGMLAKHVHDSGPETEGPEVHNLRCSNVPVENATAFAAVLALGQRLSACWSWLNSTASILPTASGVSAGPAVFMSVVCASWYWPGGSKVGSVRTRKPEASKRAVGPPVSVIRNVAVGRRHRLSPLAN